MSILLDALRKSEKSQQPARAPSIHDADVHIPVEKTFKPGLVMVLIGIAVLLGTWFIWRQYQVTDSDVYQPPGSLSVDKPSPISTPVVNPDKGTSALSKADSSRGSAGTASTARTPVESYQNSGINAEQVEPYQPTATLARVQIKPRKSPDQKESNAARPTPVALNASANKAAGTATRSSGTTTPVGRAAEKFRPHLPAPISYWELPDSVRADIFEIKFSVLVYAADSADRFVLINGQRYVENDSIQTGLKIEEIRRDGVVFSFRLYRFVIER